MHWRFHLAILLLITSGAADPIVTDQNGGVILTEFNPLNSALRSVRFTGMCISPPVSGPASTALGTQLQTLNCLRNPFQYFTLDINDRLVNTANGLCITVKDASSVPETAIIQDTCQDPVVPHQQWQWDSRGRLRPKSAPDTCVDARTQVVMTVCFPLESQRFYAWQLSLFPYENSAKAADGSVSVGGNGGGPFLFHDNGSPVKTLFVFTGLVSGASAFTCINATLFNGASISVGSCSGMSKSFTFGVGERLQGDILMGASQIPQLVGYLEFTTNKGRTFSVGVKVAPKSFASGNSFLMGIAGNSGSLIDKLQLLVMKELKSLASPAAAALINNIRYPMEATDAVGLIQTERIQIENYGEFSQTSKRSRTIEYENSYSWQLSDSSAWFGPVKLSADLPGDVGVEGQWSAVRTIAMTDGQAGSVTRSGEETIESELVNPGVSTVEWRIEYEEFNVDDLLWIGQLQVPFADGTTQGFRVLGKFSGFYVVNFAEKKSAATPL